MSSFSEDDAFEAAVPLSQRARVAHMHAQDYLSELNAAQREAVEALDGPVLMLAGAGTGKTKALTTRIAHLLRTGRARNDGVLAVTFTNKAAREMKDRVGRLLGEPAEGMPWMGTFHSIGVKLLRRHAELIGADDAPANSLIEAARPPLHLKSNFTILDTDDQIRLMKQLIVANGIDEKRWPARMLSSIIDGWKNRAWRPEQVPVAESNAFDDRGIELYRQYQRRLIELNAVDFGDLLLHCVTIFQTYPELLSLYQDRFRYILVDEYQDTNVAQYLWLRLLAQGHKNICCVGDDDQSIYGWRGAEVGNILRFEKDFPGALVVRLEQNYRSTEHILAAASGVIRGNANRLGKELFTEKVGGEKVRLIGHWDGEAEARWIGEEIEAMQGGTRGDRPRSLNEMAILVRASHQMREFEDRFLKIGLPYRVIGGPRFFERLEIRDAMAYFRLAVSLDDDLAFERIVNTPKRGIGDKALQTITRAARSNGVSLVEGARLAVRGKLMKGKAAKELETLVAFLDRWHAQVINEPDTHVELAQVILDESGYTTMWQNDKTPEAPGRLENLKELVNALEDFDNFQGFLEHVALVLDNNNNEQEEKVTLMTLHAAKGLEFPVVFLPGWEEGLFPSQRSMDESGLKGLEEERRLAYVGITRAEEICTITYTDNRRVYGQWQSQIPSRFVDELPEEHVDILTLSGDYGGFGRNYGAASFEQNVARADVYNSPGWKRMQTRTQSPRGMATPSEARGLTIDATAVSSFTIGDRVFHQKFGYGEVMDIEGDKLMVEFDKAGTKNVVSKFLQSAAGANDVPF